MDSVFDAFSAVEAGATQTSALLLDAGRINRLAWQHARDQNQPGVGELLELLLARTWKREAVPKSIVAGEAVQLAANWVVLDALLRLLDGAELHAPVDAEVRQHLQQLGKWLAQKPTNASHAQAAALIKRYLADPASTRLRKAAPVPPGAPI
jgi:hypothetical protein